MWRSEGLDRLRAAAGGSEEKPPPSGDLIHEFKIR